MSHITRIRTQMVEREYLLKALEDLEYRYTLGQGERVQVQLPAVLGARTMTFEKRGGTYECVGDWWGVRVNQREFLNTLAQRYAYHATLAKLSEQGFTVASEQKDANGRIHLLLRRVG